MIDNTAQLDRVDIELPASAPSVRLTAGVGSAGQKTWNLRRPVTVIGSKRPAHIVLHDQDVSNAHCVIVNTGREVLLKDLWTSSGTLCNKQPANLTLLKDGDILTVGGTSIQIAIRVPENESDDSGCGLTYSEPTKFAKPLVVRLDHTDTKWEVDDAVVLVGRHERSTIRIDHDEVVRRHLIIFRFLDGPAVFELGSKSGMTLNGGTCSIAALRPGDRVGIGPCTLSFEMVGVPSWDDAARESAAGEAAESRTVPVSAAPSIPSIPSIPLPPSRNDVVRLTEEAETAAGDAQPTLEYIEGELLKLQKNISNSWERLNQWQEQLREDATRISKQSAGLEVREAELEAKDAALRGQLHDLTRYHEQITERERELAKKLAEIQSERDKALQQQTDLVRREGDVARRNDELQRREHVLAQRWARLLAATCPHCGRPIRPDGGDNQNGNRQTL
ncbi:MAG: FHA domain-containing protein [Phycisphaerae bacterium]|nr:FHA domain-containing protein [Phycisphaerae bacterium]